MPTDTVNPAPAGPATLCHPAQYCTPDSLPRCLRHENEEEPMAEAICLALFLRNSTTAMLDIAATHGTDDIRAAQGFSMCMDLLLDKLEIAEGTYLFPMVDYSSTTDTALCARDGGEDNE